MPSLVLRQRRHIKKATFCVQDAALSENYLELNLLTFFVALTLIDQDEHKHVARKPEGCTDRDSGEASL